MWCWHDDVIKWKHFPRRWPCVQGIYRSPLNSPHKGQWRGALMFPLICAWINVWASNREAVDLRRHHAHYDVTVMMRRTAPRNVTALDVQHILLFFQLYHLSAHDIFPCYDDVIKWKHLSRYWLFVRGIHRPLVDSPHKGQWRSFDVLFDLRQNKRLNKLSRRRWFETPLRSLWRHCNFVNVFVSQVLHQELISPYLNITKKWILEQNWF